MEQITSNKKVYKEIILHSQQQEEATRNEHGSGTSSKKSKHSPKKKTTQTLGTTPLRGGKKKKKNPNKSHSITTNNLDKSADTSATTTSILSVPVKIKLGDDPFDLLHTMMNKSSGSIDQKINNLREAIMKKKRQYNRCLVTRRALDKKTIGLKNIYHQCKETVKDTEAQLSKLRVGSGVATTTTTALTNVLENVLKEHRMKMYLTQITMDCNECTGLNTEKETTNGTILLVEYSVEGTLDRLENFVSILENIPYVSEIIRVDISQETNVGWTGQILLEVIMLENHEASN